MVELLRITLLVVPGNGGVVATVAGDILLNLLWGIEIQRHVHTNAIIQRKFIIHRPLILEIEGKLAYVGFGQCPTFTGSAAFATVCIGNSTCRRYIVIVTPGADAVQKCRGAREAWSKCTPIGIQIERVVKTEHFQTRTNGVSMFTLVDVEVIGKLENVLIQTVENGKWLMTSHDVRNPVFLNIDHREGIGKWVAGIAESGIAYLQFIGSRITENRAQFDDSGIDFVVDLIAGIEELQGGKVGATTTDSRWVGRFLFEGIKEVIGCR